MFISLSVSLNGKPVTVHETNYRFKAYLEKLLNHGSDASVTHLVSRFWYIDSPGELKDNSGYAKRLNYLSNLNTLEHSTTIYMEGSMLNCSIRIKY